MRSLIHDVLFRDARPLDPAPPIFGRIMASGGFASKNLASLGGNKRCLRWRQKSNVRPGAFLSRDFVFPWPLQN
jgi:hypothetical protein